eukprot:XP_011672500.1 PREDICTED: uncharacterized protein LOC105442266 [Strongylocentrotus purpuratus]
MAEQRIVYTRHQLHDLNTAISASQSKINQQLNPDDLSKVQSFNDHTAQLAFQTTKLKQIRKFDQLRPRKPIRTNDPPIKDTVVNLSQHRLSQAEHQVLSLGLNFAVAPKKIPFSDIVQQLYGEPTQLIARQLQRDLVKSAKLTNHLAFLKLCRDSDTIPPGLQLKSSVDTPKAQRILHQAGIDLTRERIVYTRHQLHDLNTAISASQSKINQQLNPDDLSKVQSFNDHTAQLAFQTTKLKQIRKFDQLRSRKPIRTNDPPIKDTVVNLSQHRLSQAEHQVLSLGLNFAVAPKKIPFSDIVQQVEPKLRFLSKAAANDIRLKITNALAEAKPPKPNLSKVERSAIQDLRKNQSIHILQADKGNATVVMDQDTYEDKICDLLKDKETYSKLKRDPTLANERKINQQLLTLHRSDALPKALYFQLRSSSAKSPILFGQPKIHKPLIPLRPIISTRGSSCYNTARHLANILQPLVGQTQHHVTNSKHFIDILSKTKIQPSDTLVSFDVTSLFTSVPVDQACDIIKQRLISDPDLESRTKLTPDQIHDLLLTCLHSNSFKWRNDFYKQLQGAAMGSPLSPIIANIFMEHLEHQALKY